MAPIRAWATMALAAGAQPLLGDDLHRNLSAAYELISRAGLTHTRPSFGITHVSVGNREVEVREEPAARTPFGTLLHFKKDIKAAQPRVLVVAPLSGHFATLLRATVRTLLPEHDVFITDWHNARDVPLTAGRFGIDEYVEHLIKYLRGAWPGLACARGLPALCCRALCRGADGAGRQSGAAAQHDADGRPDRLPGQPDQGQRARQQARHRLVRADADGDSAGALSRRVPPRLSWISFSLPRS